MTQLPDFRLETHFAKWEFSARHHLCASDAESLSLADLLEMATPEDRTAFDGMFFGDDFLRGDEVEAAGHYRVVRKDLAIVPAKVLDVPTCDHGIGKRGQGQQTGDQDHLAPSV